MYTITCTNFKLPLLLKYHGESQGKLWTAIAIVGLYTSPHYLLVYLDKKGRDRRVRVLSSMEDMWHL